MNIMKTIFQYGKHYLFMTMGAAMTAVSVSIFCLPNKIVGGGASGISILLYHLLRIQPGVTTAVMNIILLIIAWFVLGKRFVGRTVYGACALSFFIQIFTYVPPITQNLFIASISGAVFEGIGMGIMLADGGSSGGTDIIGRLIQHIFPHINIGTLMIVIDTVIISCTLIFFKNGELVFYGLLLLFISGTVINNIIIKLNVSKLAFIISEKGEETSSAIMKTISRGVTILDAKGAYTMDEKKVLMCALKDSEMPRLKREILSIDENAFVIFTEAQQVIGNGFYFYY